jgi:poly-gamma-glutamate capsule biosynthesis protein CapA/YwtB (metallophosphatase superfamily)
MILLLIVTTYFVACGEESPPERGVTAAGEAAGDDTDAQARSDRTFTLVASGDILIHGAVLDQAAAYGDESGREFDFKPMFDEVRGLISGADAAICHLEVPISRNNQFLSTYPLFNAPRELAVAIKDAGYDSCSTASNHALDNGQEGVSATLDVLDDAGVMHDGTARSRRESLEPAILDVNGLKVAHLSYTYGLNGVEGRPEPRWLVELADAGRILKEAKAARAAGAEFVVVSLHWGIEYQSDPSEFQRSLAKKLLASPDIGVIVGHHAHVVQPIDRVKKKYVVYGVGNFLSNQRPGATATCCLPQTQDGLLVHIEVKENATGFAVDRVLYTPTWVEPGTYRILPVADALEEPDTSPEQSALLAQSWRRTVATVRALGGRPKPAHKPDGLP